MVKVDLGDRAVELKSDKEVEAADALGYKRTGWKILFNQIATAEYAADQIEARASAQEERG